MVRCVQVHILPLVHDKCTWTASTSLDIVGPLRVQSFCGKWYVVVVVDDFSRYSWVYFMASKDEAFGHFRSLVLKHKL
jgi:hypothetical protein